MKKDEVIQRLEGLKNGRRSFDDVRDVKALEEALSVLKQPPITFKKMIDIIIAVIPIFIVEFGALRMLMRIFPNIPIQALSVTVALIMAYPIYKYICYVAKRII